MSQSDLWEELNRSRGYGDVFDIVKRAVMKVLGLKRSGLMLYLGDLPLRRCLSPEKFEGPDPERSGVCRSSD